jgi:hypothetical protein
MISDKRAKLAVRITLENECTKCNLTFLENDINAVLCAKIKTHRESI